jgi:putative (di)nucleoside polyphosphate hydrolase
MRLSHLSLFILATLAFAEIRASEKPYRPCVAGIFVDDTGLLLVGRRTGTDSWQFPQGGIEGNETPLEAIKREMAEELGIFNFEVLKISANWITYDFPAGIGGEKAKKFKGQTQIWFLLKLKPDQQPDLARASDKEFDAFKWITAKEAMAEAIPWKIEAYKAGLSALEVPVAP